MGFRNMYIAASAGSGKTYQLVNRFISLLSLQKMETGQTDVSRLIAVTFTRKAAGEFKGRILSALAEAAQGEDEARRFWQTRVYPIIMDAHTGICPEVTLPAIDSFHRFFSEMLRELTNDFSRLNLSTIDSFFQQMVLTLGPELGLGSSSTMDDAQKKSSNRSSLDLTYLPTAGEPDEGLEADLRIFLSHEHERETPDRHLFEQIRDFHEAVLELPHALWGGEADEMSDEQLALFGLEREDVRLWMTEAEFTAATETMQHCVEHCKKKTKVLVEYVKSIATPEGALKEPPKGKNLEEYLGICQAHGVNVYEVLRARFSLYWRSLLARTAALHRLILDFDRRYKSSVRDRGKHVFSDIPRLLQEQSSAESVLLMQERTDARLDHWLLDEFQDTSHIQYAILHDILTNRVSSDEGSVFMVGDAKQSIYQFRGGDPRIFLGVRSSLFGLKDESFCEQSAELPLDTSYRSSSEVLEFSNDIFTDITLAANRANRAACERWEKLGYQQHTAAPCNADMQGLAAIYRVPAVGGPDWQRQRKELIYDSLAAILAEKRPAGTGQPVPSCAILVRTRGEEKAVFQELGKRREAFGFEGPLVICNSCEAGRDSPAGLALTHLFRWLNSPSDEKSLSQLRLSPLWPALCTDFCQEASHARQQAGLVWQGLQAILRASGMSGLLHRLIRRCPSLSCNDFIRQRIKVWLNAADEFDSNGGSLADWLTTAEGLTVREEPQGNAIRIMTTFQAKGLEFDMVLLPQLSFSGMADYDNATHLRALDKESGETLGVLLKPDKQVLTMHEKVMNTLFSPWQAEAEFAEFCVLYVAVTRAKYATYVIICDESANARNTDDKGESVSNMMRRVAASFPEHRPHDEVSLIGTQATCIYRRGREDWVNSWRQKAAKAPDDEESKTGELNFNFPALIRSTPSGRAASARHSGAQSPRLYEQKNSGTSFGTLVHACFEQVGWLAEGELPAFHPAQNAEEEAAQQAVLHALREPAVHALFHRPAPPCRLFREQSIEALRDGRVWVSGQIDRLHVQYADTTCRKATRALIIDFKSDRCDAVCLKPEYAPQMREYREMVALAFGLPLDAVEVCLIHAPRQGKASTLPYTSGELR